MLWFKKKTTPKRCEDCKWFRSHANVKYSRCSNPLAAGDSRNLVSTMPLAQEEYGFCDILRESDYRCSREARWFVSRPPPAPPEPPYRGVLDNIDCTLLRIARTLESPPKPKRK